MSQSVVLSLFSILYFLSPASAGNQLKSDFTAGNSAVCLVYHSDSGTYDLVETATGRKAVAGAHAEIQEWKSDDQAYTRASRKRSFSDETGKGSSLTVECAAPGKPTIISEFRVYEKKTFIVLRTGLKNTGVDSLRIMNYKPLAGGQVFSGTEWSDVRTLTANTAENDPKVVRSIFTNSANNILLTLKQDGARRSLVAGALKTADFTKWFHIVPVEGKGGGVTIEASDPLGRLVDPGETYMPEDSFYLSFLTPDPFKALEEYAWQLRAVTHAKPNLYDFPTVCAWYAGVWKTKGAQDHPEKSTYKINTSSGMVEEAEKIKACGFLNYSRAAVRLVPDNYTTNNPQGWWDDEHWKLHGLYTEPYETTRKLGKGMHERGCLAFTYIQPAVMYSKDKLISLDFRTSHTNLLIGKDLNNPIDFSLPEAQDYIRSKFAPMKRYIDGFMVDYCDEMWRRIASKGGFADRKMTATAFYRSFFLAIRAGIGADARIHERNVTSPNNELTVGIVDSERTANDTDQITPNLITKSGLRWYKNRVIYSFDMDSKELNNSWKTKGWTGTDQDGRRMMLTMAYVAASRLLTANSFRDLSKETLYDLSRTFPYPSEPKSARPIDAFTHEGYPRVYDYEVTPEWHQVTLFNNTMPTKSETITLPLAGEQVDGALGLDPKAEYHVYDFWNDKYVGKLKGSDKLEQALRPGEARMLSVRKVEKNPQVISSNRHIMQGHYELSDMKWSRHKLSGKAKVVAGEPLKIVIACNGLTPEGLQVPGDNKLTVLTLESAKNETVKWRVAFK